jgi:predicted ATPase
VAAALAMVEDTGERWCAAELHRIEGELAIRQAVDAKSPSSTPAATPQPKLPSPVASRAEHCFEKAIAVASAQEARSWELRARMSLGRLYQRQDKRTDACRIVQEGLDWFKEGHDTEDLKSAQALVKACQASTRARR